MRNEARNNPKANTFTSARNLLGVLRLATALARLRLANVVDREDVREANRLIEMSKSSISRPVEKPMNPANSNLTKMYGIVREMAGESKVIKVSDIMERCTGKGFNRDQINDMIEQYEEMNIWLVNQAKTKITLV